MKTYTDITPTTSVKWDKETKTFLIKGQPFTLEEALTVADLILSFMTGKFYEASDRISNEELENKDLLAEHIDKRIADWWQGEIVKVD